MVAVRRFESGYALTVIAEHHAFDSLEPRFDAVEGRVDAVEGPGEPEGLHPGDRREGGDDRRHLSPLHSNIVPVTLGLGKAPVQDVTALAFAANHSATAAATVSLLLSEWVPGMRTTVRFGPSGGIPNGSRSPWTTSVGTVTASSSERRLVSGRPGGWRGNARQTMPIAPVSATVRHATLAPDDRPPTKTGRLLSGPLRSCWTTAS